MRNYVNLAVPTMPLLVADKRGAAETKIIAKIVIHNWYKPAMQWQHGVPEVRQYCVVDDAGKSLMRAAMQQMQMSARAYHRILKLAHTIADLAESERIETAHIAEAIQYRPRNQLQ
jgi:predicted ATPase with chaperone activity